MEFSLPHTFAPKNKSTIGGTFSPLNFHSQDLSFPGTFAPIPVLLKERITVAPSTKEECSSVPTNAALQSVLASRHVRLTYDVG